MDKFLNWLENLDRGNIGSVLADVIRTGVLFTAGIGLLVYLNILSKML